MSKSSQWLCIVITLFLYQTVVLADSSRVRLHQGWIAYSKNKKDVGKKGIAIRFSIPSLSRLHMCYGIACNRGKFITFPASARDEVIAIFTTNPATTAESERLKISLAVQKLRVHASKESHTEFHIGANTSDKTFGYRMLMPAGDALERDIERYGYPTDCWDNSHNAMMYLLALQRQGYFKFHKVSDIVRKIGIVSHFSATITELNNSESPPKVVSEDKLKDSWIRDLLLSKREIRNLKQCLMDRSVGGKRLEPHSLASCMAPYNKTIPFINLKQESKIKLAACLVASKVDNENGCFEDLNGLLLRTELNPDRMVEMRRCLDVGRGPACFDSFPIFLSAIANSDPSTISDVSSCLGSKSKYRYDPKNDYYEIVDACLGKFNEVSLVTDEADVWAVDPWLADSDKRPPVAPVKDWRNYRKDGVLPYQSAAMQVAKPERVRKLFGAPSPSNYPLRWFENGFRPPTEEFQSRPAR